MRIMTVIDRAAPRVVLASLIVLGVAGTGYVGAMNWNFLPNAIGDILPDVSLWMQERLSPEALTRVVHALLYISMAACIAALFVSLVAGPRAWRIGGCNRRSLALMSCGVVLGALLCGGPLWYYRHARSSIDASLARSQVAREEIRRKLESGGIEGSDRQRVWLFYAQTSYGDEGIQVEIPDGEGGTMLFEPSERDREVRAFTLEMRKNLAPPYQFAARWALRIVIGLAIGFLTPIAPRPVGGGKAG